MKYRISNILPRKDYNRAIQFAVQGMHLDWYLRNSLLLHLYGRYFLYLELLRASRILTVYSGDQLMGILMCDIAGEKKQHNSCWMQFYVNLVNFIQHTFVKDGVEPYDNANRQMFAQYAKTAAPDGEINFFAVAPEAQGLGIGSILLKELENGLSGKELFLYTDTGCSYAFYERRGFVKQQACPIIMEISGRTVEITCLLYSKTVPPEESIA